MQIQSFGITDKGMVREYNEDNFIINTDERIFIVADGMGGLSKGDLASRIAVDAIIDFIKDSRIEDITWPIKPQEQYSLEENRLLAAISLANWKIYQQFQEDVNNRGMGTTLVALLVDGDKVIIANVGDSRIYLFRNNSIEQLTDDHSLVMEEVRRGNLTLDEARNHPQKHVINRALGISESTQADISSLNLQAEDLYLLCTDGLTDMISDEEMLSIVESNKGETLEELCENFTAAANTQGGKDNITVVLVSFSE